MDDTFGATMTVPVSIPALSKVILHLICRIYSDLLLSCMRRISTKRKKELYNLSSLLLHLIVFIGLLLSLGTDSDKKDPGQDRNLAPKNEKTAPLEGLFANLKR
jgi:hypothetical protein